MIIAPRQVDVPLLAQPLAPHQRLAAAVIAQAVLDARDGLLSVSEMQRRRARAFLGGSDGLRYWCGVAGVDCTVIQRRARAVIGGLASEHV